MFRQIARPDPAALLREPAALLGVRLESLWASRSRARTVQGYPIQVVQLPPQIGRPTRTDFVWDHLIYAYLIENTRIVEVARRVLYELVNGERLGVPRKATTYEWARATEELFFAYGPPLLAHATVSQIRPDPEATRRNAYQRMFGMDLNHGVSGESATKYVRAEVSNTEFVRTFEAFLSETWRAIENVRNATGANPTDAAAIASLALRLQTMLNERRGGSPTAPNLAREEFSAVALTSWLHLLVDFDNDVLADLQAQGTSAAERLARLGERVGIPTHRHAHSYFVLGPLVSLLLIEIEAGLFSTSAGAEALYLGDPGTNRIRDDIQEIVDHWSRATGRTLKAAPVPVTVAAGSTNGRTAVAVAGG